MKSLGKFLNGLFVALLVLSGMMACIPQRKNKVNYLYTPSPQQIRVSSTPIRAYSTPTSLPASLLIIGDGGLLTRKSCGPPCFLEMIPGKTHYAEAENILVGQGLMDDCSTIDKYEFAQKKGIGGWWCSGFKVEYNRETGIVSRILFRVTPPLQLQEIINRYGLPDAVSIVNMESEHDPLLDGEILYFEYRMTLFSDQWQKSWKYEFAPTTLIDGAIYYDEARFEEEELDGLEYFGHPWNGYGTYYPGP